MACTLEVQYFLSKIALDRVMPLHPASMDSQITLAEVPPFAAGATCVLVPASGAAAVLCVMGGFNGQKKGDTPAVSQGDGVWYQLAPGAVVMLGAGDMVRLGGGPGSDKVALLSSRTDTAILDGSCATASRRENSWESKPPHVLTYVDRYTTDFAKCEHGVFRCDTLSEEDMPGIEDALVEWDIDVAV